MTREASVATLRRLAEADDALSKAINGDAPNVMPLIEEQHRALAAYRSEIAPLRTRAEVDAEIVTTVRSWFANSGGQPVGMADATVRALVLSCREPTRDSGPSSADAEEVPSPRPPASPAGADLLRRAELESAIAELVTWDVTRSWGGLDQHGGVFLRFEKGDGRAEKLSDLCRELARLGKRSGPPGAVAAKESRDNAAAPEGAAKALAGPGLYAWKRVPQALWESLGHELTHDDRYHHLRPDLIKAIQDVLAAAHSTAEREEERATLEDPEPCGCEHTEALLVRLRRIHEICNVHASIDGDRQLEIWKLSDV